jgi:Fe-S cluster biogenesis protein NfuA
MNKQTILAQVEQVLDERVRPGLKLHAGGIQVIDFDEKSGVLFIKLEGTCQGCGFANETLYGFVEEELIANIPDLKAISPVDPLPNSEEDSHA